MKKFLIMFSVFQIFHIEKKKGYLFVKGFKHVGLHLSPSAMDTFDCRCPDIILAATKQTNKPTTHKDFFTQLEVSTILSEVFAKNFHLSNADLGA